MFAIAEDFARASAEGEEDLGFTVTLEGEEAGGGGQGNWATHSSQKRKRALRRLKKLLPAPTAHGP
jgi:hypothetical protein